MQGHRSVVPGPEVVKQTSLSSSQVISGFQDVLLDVTRDPAYNLMFYLRPGLSVNYF